MTDQNNWIPLEDKKPKTNERVLICFNGKNNKNNQHITIATYIAPRTVKAEDFLDEECCDSFYESDYEENTDTYWTPSGFYETLWESETSIFVSNTVSNTVTHWKVIDLPLIKKRKTK